MPRRLLFVGVVAALAYGVLTFLLFGILVPIEVYVIWIAPQLEEAGIAHGAWLVGLVRSARDIWWWLVPIAQLALTWRITKHLLPRWAHICASPGATAPEGGRAP